MAVLGPQAVGRRSLLSDYYGDDVCWTGSCSGHECYDCIPTIAEAVASYNTGGTTTAAAGVDINSNATSGIAAAIGFSVLGAAWCVFLASRPFLDPNASRLKSRALDVDNVAEIPLVFSRTHPNARWFLP